MSSLSYDYLMEERRRSVSFLKLILLGFMRYNPIVIDHCFSSFSEDMKKHWTYALSFKKEEYERSEKT